MHGQEGLPHRSNSARALDSSPARGRLHRMPDDLVPTKVWCSRLRMVAKCIEQAPFGAGDAMRKASDHRANVSC